MVVNSVQVTLFTFSRFDSEATPDSIFGLAVVSFYFSYCTRALSEAPKQHCLFLQQSSLSSFCIPLHVMCAMCAMCAMCTIFGLETIYKPYLCASCHLPLLCTYYTYYVHIYLSCLHIAPVCTYLSLLFVHIYRSCLHLSSTLMVHISIAHIYITVHIIT